MTLKHSAEYRERELAKGITDKIKAISRKNIRIMEVCGTHTVSIFRSGIRSVLPDTINLLSGPGCPVCVTAQKDIDAFISLSRTEDVIITTFGDLMRVPGSGSSLQKESAEGRDIRMVYSTFDALKIAEKNPDKEVIFLGVGFETTAPTIAASILTAKKTGLTNFSVFAAHKTVPPALFALMKTKNVTIDGFLLPGHVSVVIGMTAYQQFADKYQIPCVVGGFEPADILQAIYNIAKQIERNRPNLENAYPRAVTTTGNEKAQAIMKEVFIASDADWRGIGTIAKSGLDIREEFKFFNTKERFPFPMPDVKEPKGCACGEILTGIKIPTECALFKTVCTPTDPVGPCMVSTEGTCAAYYKYG
jgi:hydrogenase expression/formation protein HypD